MVLTLQVYAYHERVVSVCRLVIHRARNRDDPCVRGYVKIVPSGRGTIGNVIREDSIAALP